MKNDQLYLLDVIKHLICLVGRLKQGEDPIFIADIMLRDLKDLQQRYTSNSVVSRDYIYILEEISEDYRRALMDSKTKKHQGKNSGNGFNEDEQHGQHG